MDETNFSKKRADLSNEMEKKSKSKWEVLG